MKNMKNYAITFVALVSLLFGFTSCSKSSEPKLKLSFDKPVYEMELGSTLEIIPNVENGKLEELELEWFSYNENIVKCENGELIAINPGETTIRVEVSDKPYALAVATIKVLYEEEMPIVHFDTVKTGMLLGETQQLNYTLSATDVTVVAEYKSLNENVIMVSNTGLITAIEEGSAVVIVKIIDAENPERYLTKQFLITVTEMVYNINYVIYDGENNNANPKEYTDRLCPITLEEPTRLGYTFKGWYLDNAYTQPITEIEEGTKSNLTLFAKWEADVYTISFDTNGGLPISNVDYTIETLGFYFPTPVKIGYTFVKWVDTATNEERGFIKNGTLENITVKAEWVPTVYSITYNFNDGVYTEEYVKEYTIEDETITLITPTKEHYIFNGWCLDELCETAIIKEIPAGSYGNKVFYAKWTPVTYYISYEGLQFVGLQQGHNNNENPYQYNIESETITFKEPTRLGYTFKGWYSDEEHTTPITELPAGSYGDLVIYADWEIIVYNIEYKDGVLEGSASPDIDNPNELVTTYTVENETITLKPATRKGYKFVEWTPTNKIEKGSTGNKIFEAVWEIEIYSINYLDNLNEGTKSPIVINNNIKTYSVEEEINFEMASRIGYNFTGWLDENDVAITKIEKGNVGNRTIKANWSIIVYSISYSGFEFSESNSPLATYPGEKPTTRTVEDIINLDNPTRVGYEFAGWNGKINGNITYTSSSNITIGNIPGDVELEATWELITYSITYNLNGGINGANPTTYTIESADITLQNPTREGYNFVNWAEGNKVNTGSTGNKTFTANWTPIEYTISYELNGGTNGANPTTYTIESADITLQNPTREGYNFVNWSEGNTINTGSTGNKTFTANWTPIEYTISYELNGGTNGANPTTYTIESADITLQNPTREGYNFVNWAEGNTINTGSTGNKTFTANWTPIEYTISYELNGGTNGANPTTYTIESADITLQNPTREGYDFVNWSEGNKINTGSTGNKTFTANWTPIEYTISYELNGGTNGANPTTYTIESADITLQNPTREGYNFVNWAEGNKINTGSTGNKTFTANWTPIEYTISYELNGGTNGANPTTYTIESADITLQNPTKVGYEFKGWYSDSSLTIVADTTIEQGSTGELTFYASWEEKTLLEYKINGSSITITAINETDEENVVIPSEINGIPVKEIAANVIANNKKVKTITIPASVTTINSYAFSGGFELDTAKNKVIPTDDDYTTNVEEFIVEEGNEKYFADESGVLCSRGSIGGESYTVIVSYPTALSDEVFTVAPNVKYINPGAFAGTKNLVTVLFTNNTKLEVISEAAFYGSNLTYIKIPKTVSGIRSSAFEECRKLGGSGSSFEFEEGNVNHKTGLGIGSYAFSNTGFSNFTVPRSCTSIYNKAFATDQTKYATSISKLYVYGDSLGAIKNCASNDPEKRAKWNHRYVGTDTLITVSEL